MGNRYFIFFSLYLPLQIITLLYKNTKSSFQIFSKLIFKKRKEKKIIPYNILTWYFHITELSDNLFVSNWETDSSTRKCYFYLFLHIESPRGCLYHDFEDALCINKYHIIFSKLLAILGKIFHTKRLNEIININSFPLRRTKVNFVDTI